MGYKKWGKEISFANLAVSKSLEHNRRLKPGGINFTPLPKSKSARLEGRATDFRKDR